MDKGDNRIRSRTLREESKRRGGLLTCNAKDKDFKLREWEGKE